MRILLTGSNSLLGKALWETAPKEVSLILTFLPSSEPNQKRWVKAPMNITDKATVKRTLARFKPDWVIHLAALSDVDSCEKNPDQAYAVNVVGTENLVNTAKKASLHFLFTSSNGIFDGKRPSYTERDKPHPLHVYGKTKLEAEQTIAHSKLPSIIVRPNAMYGWPPVGARQNPVTWAVEQLSEGIILDMVTDNFISPLYAPSAAEAIWKLIEADARGIYHIAGKTRVSRYAWTKEIAKVFGFNLSLVHPVKSGFFPNLAPRPRDTSFSTAKLKQTIDWRPLTLKEGLRRMRNEGKQLLYC